MVLHDPDRLLVCANRKADLRRLHLSDISTELLHPFLHLFLSPLEPLEPFYQILQRVKIIVIKFARCGCEQQVRI